MSFGLHRLTQIFNRGHGHNHGHEDCASSRGSAPSSVTNTGSRGNAVPPPIVRNVDPESKMGRQQMPLFTPAGVRIPPPTKSSMDLDDARSINVDPTEFELSCVHTHPRNYVDEGVAIAHMILEAYDSGIKHFVINPIPTNVISPNSDKERQALGTHGCDCYYVPTESNHPWFRLTRKALRVFRKRSKLYVNTEVDATTGIQLFNAVDRGISWAKEGLSEKEILAKGGLLPKHLDKIDIGITGLHLGDINAVNHLLKKLDDIATLNRALHKLHPEEMKGHRLNFTLCGEMTVYKEIVQWLYAGRKAQANLKGNVEPLRSLIRLAGIIGLPFQIHCDVDKPEGLKFFHEKNKPPIHLEDFKELARSCQSTTLIWAHCGIGRFVTPGKNYVKELRKFMEDPTLSHVYMDISWKVVAEKITDPEMIDEWAEFFVDYKDRLIFGTDALAPQNKKQWLATYEVYKEKMFPKLREIETKRNNGIPLPKEESAEYKIKLSNYEKVLYPARKRVDAFVEDVLPFIADSVRSIANHRDIPRKLDGILELRNEKFAETVIKKPERQEVIEGYQKTDVPQHSYRLGKRRTKQELKSTLHQLSCGKFFRPYGRKGKGDRNSVGDGNPTENAEMRRKADKLEGSLDRHQEKLKALRGKDDFCREERLSDDELLIATRRLGALKNELRILKRRIGFSPIDEAGEVSSGLKALEEKVEGLDLKAIAKDQMGTIARDKELREKLRELDKRLDEFLKDAETLSKKEKNNAQLGIEERQKRLNEVSQRIGSHTDVRDMVEDLAKVINADHMEGLINFGQLLTLVLENETKLSRLQEWNDHEDYDLGEILRMKEQLGHVDPNNPSDSKKLFDEIAALEKRVMPDYASDATSHEPTSTPSSSASTDPDGIFSPLEASQMTIGTDILRTDDSNGGAPNGKKNELLLAPEQLKDLERAKAEEAADMRRRGRELLEGMELQNGVKGEVWFKGLQPW